MTKVNSRKIAKVATPVSGEFVLADSKQKALQGFRKGFRKGFVNQFDNQFGEAARVDVLAVAVAVGEAIQDGSTIATAAKHLAIESVENEQVNRSFHSLFQKQKSRAAKLLKDKVVIDIKTHETPEWL